MKLFIKSFIAIALCQCGLAMAQDSNSTDGSAISVLQPPGSSDRVVVQDLAVPPAEPQQADVAAPAPMIASDSAPVECCRVCCAIRCRCRTPKVPTDVCLIDPCGCSYKACVDVPACCAGQSPTVAWRDGVGHRQIATLCWNCCDYRAKVVVTGRGKTRVHD